MAHSRRCTGSLRRLALAAGLLAVAACGGSSSRSAGTGTAKGQAGLYFLVNVSRPVNGTITSDDGQLRCGPAGGADDACGPARYDWSATATLTATPAPGMTFGAWAGDCSYRGPCVLDTRVSGSDKWVAAAFGPPGQVGHGNFTSPTVHGPAYVAFVSGAPDAFACNAAGCHGANLTGAGIAPSCDDCHAKAGFPSWRTNCSFCHGFPPATGAHAAHYGLAGRETTSTYGDVRVLQDLYPAATPTTAPGVYAFGCGNCHPIDPAKHLDGKVEVTLYEPAAPLLSLKARNASTAAYDAASGTCSGVYCHSSGQELPAFATAPGWTSGAHLGCSGCHGNPPRYASGPAGATDANSHLGFPVGKGKEAGHFLGMPGPYHGSEHGAGNYAAYYGAWGATMKASPITCQQCHFDTTDPSSTGSSGFYWLDTTGDYHLPGGTASRLTTPEYAQLQCTSCHYTGGKSPPGVGRVLPLRHVNGSRDVVFDERPLPASLVNGLPPDPYRPVFAVWAYSYPDFSLSYGRALPNVTYSRPGTTGSGTMSLSLSGASYDPSPGKKTCSNVNCHFFAPQGKVSWGGRTTCGPCHGIPPT
ncbi:CxxxxCH/CxxCH domain c-type cytochrome [Anaeromyxobacter paludicola]|nr:CxxxxCH/CxxCH domain-containing protein [Anaeromyxobacter paludicola]